MAATTTATTMKRTVETCPSCRDAAVEAGAATRQANAAATLAEATGNSSKCHITCDFCIFHDPFGLCSSIIELLAQCSSILGTRGILVWSDVTHGIWQWPGALHTRD
jgi:hypothetical protein